MGSNDVVAMASALDDAASTMELIAAALDYATSCHGDEDGPDLYRIAIATADLLKQQAQKCAELAARV